MQPDDATLERWLTVARGAAEESGRIALAAWPGRPGARELATSRKADGSVTTEVDREIEDLVRELIGREFPGHTLLGEELGGDAPSPAGITWVVDPIDGTSNFVRGLPFFTTEIAILRDGVPVVGVSTAPALGRTLWARRGGGAFMDGERLSVSEVSTLSQAFVVHGGVPHFRSSGLLEGLGRLCAGANKSRGFGDSWSYHYLASGRIDAVVEARARLWDFSAASVLVSEAGGRVTDLQGDAIGPSSKSVVATNGRLHDEILTALVE
jgi:histidinol-phosphatase